MKREPTSFIDMISQWPSLVALSEDLGVPYQTAAAMKVRKSIGPEHWARVVETAPKHGIRGITFESLTKFAEQRRAETRERRSA